jgi:hypothetical protein
MNYSIIILVVLTALILTVSTQIYAQVEEQEGNTEGTATKMTDELLCESDSGLLCSNSELELCLLRTDQYA